jgi:sugar phosphate isomerase/epimerase
MQDGRKHMTSITRSEFLKLSAGLAALLPTARRATAAPLGLPIGIQPYTVRDSLKADFPGTLRKLYDMGYRELELSGGRGYGDFYGHKPAELRKLLTDMGWQASSCHYGPPADDAEWARNIEHGQQLHIKYMLCATPPKAGASLDGWKRTAALFNHLGEMCKRAGMQFAYHNHNFEFRILDGTTGYDELLRSTDNKLVKMELDCFWAVFAGKDPVKYITSNPGRFELLHIKDLKPGYQATTGEFKGNPFAEVGRGIINWKQIFTAASKNGLKRYYVEQDMWDRPSLECARISIDYLKKLSI